MHQILGPGFKESIYRNALLIELSRNELPAETEKDVVVRYEGQVIGRHRLDIIVAGRTIIELKTVDGLCKAHYAQVRSYLKATDFPVAILVNFASEKADFRRIERR